MEAEQKIVQVEDIAFPVIMSGGVTYYPVSFIEKHVLIRQRGTLLASVKTEDRLKFEVDFNHWNAGVHISNCISEDILIDRLNKMQLRTLSVMQRKEQNKLRRYLKIVELDTEEFEWDHYKLKWTKGFDKYTKELVRRIVASNESIRSRKCKDCYKILPLTDNFFYRETSNANLFSNSCSMCRVNIKHYSSDDDYENYLIRKNDRLLNSYIDRNYISLYKEYRKKTINRLPDSIYTKDALKRIMIDLNEKGIINEDNLSAKILKDDFRLDLKLFEKTSLTEVYQWLYGEKFYLDKWKYPMYIFSGDVKLTKELAIEIFNRYLKENEIVIDSPTDFDYQEIIHACYLRGIIGKDKGFSGLGEFFVYYWEGKYAGYQFRNIGNYYRTSDNNVLSDLRHLVEIDMKLEVVKIPLYITKGLLQRDYRSLYNFMRSDERSLFYWFNILYPDKFIEADFTIGNYRNDFDSIEEQQVDDVLREYFDNVVYNYNTSGQVVELKGKRPDWFIMTEKGVWLVEYFGMYIEKQKYNPVISDYIENTHEKLRLYEEMKGYNFLLVYPSDIEKGFLGLRDKLLKLQEKA